MKPRLSVVFAMLLGLSATWSGAARAHHSFAVFFSADKEVVSITGTVKAFNYTNPHGLIELAVPAKGAQEQVWRVETNSPSILNRRGWTKESIKPGDVVTIQGWGARDGSNWMRLRGAFRTDGSPIGRPLTSEGDKP